VGLPGAAGDHVTSAGTFYVPVRFVAQALGYVVGLGQRGAVDHAENGRRTDAVERRDLYRDG
jgi:hypothetical protein